MTYSQYSSIFVRFIVVFSLRTAAAAAAADSSPFTNSEPVPPSHSVPRLRTTFSEIFSVLQLPNPLKDPARCGLNSTVVTSTLLCDPEAVLGDAERLALHERLKRLEEVTADLHAEDACRRRGVRVGIAIIQRPLTINHAPFALSASGPGVENVAQYLLHRGWSLDRQCHRSAVLVYANLGQRFVFERDTAMPVFADEMDFLIATEQSAMKRISVFQAFDNLLSAFESVAERRLAGRDVLLGGSKTDASRSAASLNRTTDGCWWWTLTYVSLLLLMLVLQVVVVWTTRRRFAALQRRRLHHTYAANGAADVSSSPKAISLATHTQEEPSSEAET